MSYIVGYSFPQKILYFFFEDWSQVVLPTRAEPGEIPHDAESGSSLFAKVPVLGFTIFKWSF